MCPISENAVNHLTMVESGVIYGVGSLCLSFTTVRYRKDYKRDVTFVCSLINFDRHRLIMIIIAGRPASEFLGLHK